MISYLLVISGIVSSAMAQIMLKKSGQFTFLKDPGFFIFFICGGIFYVLSFGLYVYLLKVFNLSKISPFMTIATMLLVVAAGLFIFKETISIKQGAGIALGMISIMLIIA
jgi:uncharacterized membrane protein